MDDLDTIDGAQPRAEPVREAASSTSADYAELAAIERHHYQIVGEIAKGGMGRVLEARDRRLGRSVAIKELLPKNRDHARRFEREARITARLQHPSIIHIYEAGVWPGGEPFFAMTRVEGRSLDKVVAERTTFVERIGLLPNVTAVVDALAYAHSERVVHRDLKPSNVLIGEFGETVVIDWGLAKDLEGPSDPTDSLSMRVTSPPDETASGSVVGTPAYMPPEQARGESVDERADVYALGALLYHVLVGVPPFTGGGSDDVLDKVKTGVPVPIRDREPAVPADLVAIVGKAMARERNDRYPSAAELATDLKRFQTGQLVAAHNYTPRQLLWRWLRRYRVVLAIAAVAVVVLAAVGLISVQQIVTEKDRAEDNQHKAERRRAALLEERGRSELRAGHAGVGLIYLVGTVVDGLTGARRFLIAEAMRPFAAELHRLTAGPPLAISPTRKMVATGGGGVVRLWTLDGEERQTLATSSPAQIKTLAFDPSGRWIAAGGADGITRVWSVNGGPARELKGDKDPIVDVAWSPDGRRLVTAGATARVWDVATGAKLATQTCQAGTINSARFSPDGTRVLTASSDRTACVWSAGDGVMITLAKLGDPVNLARWSADGTRIVAATDGGANVVESVLGKPITPTPLLAGSEVAIAIISADDRWLLTVSADHVARVWDLPSDAADAAMMRPIELPGNGDAILDATFSADGERIATAGQDGVARVWATATGQPIAAFEHAEAVEAVEFAADDRLVTACHDGTTRIWNLRLGVEKAHTPLDSPVHAVAVSVDGIVAAGTDDGRVTVWGRAKPLVLRGHRGRVLAVAFSPDGKQLVTAGEDRAVLRWNPVTGEQLDAVGDQEPPIHQVTFDGDTLVTVTDEGIRWFVDGKLEGSRLDLHVDALAIRDGLAVGATSKGLLAWDIHKATPPQRIATPGQVTALAFAQDGKRLVVAGRGFTTVHEVVDRHVVAKPTGALDHPTGSVVDLAWSHDGSLIYTASDDGVAGVWDVEKGKLLATRVVHGAASRLAVGPGDDALYVASDDGSVTTWDVQATELSADEIDKAIADYRLPWKLGDDDVVRLSGGP